MFRILLTTLAIFIVYVSFSQTVTGSWYGRADVMMQGSNNNYLTELILKQKGNTVEGIFGYYFKDSYQSFFIRGTYDSKTREVYIKNLPVLFYKSEPRNGIECPMHFEGILMVSKLKNSLNGYFYSEDKYKYTCPELRVTLQLDATENQDSVLRNTTAGRKFWQPHPEDFVISNTSNSHSGKIALDGIDSSYFHPTTSLLTKEAEKRLVEKFESRKNTYTKDLEMESDSIRISFYDNGDIDGDSISVFLNKLPVIVKQELTGRSLNIYITLDTLKDVNEISMFADNLGKYPPNTALMLITDGINRHEIYLSSNLTQNSTVRLKRKKTP